MAKPRDVIAWQDMGGGIVRPIVPKPRPDIAVPEAPEVATHDSVTREHFRERAANRIVTTQERWQDMGGGIVRPGDAPRREAEQALTDRPERATTTKAAPIFESLNVSEVANLPAYLHGAKRFRRYQ